MKYFFTIILLAAGTNLRAADMDASGMFDPSHAFSHPNEEAAPVRRKRGPALDPKRIINESNSFLKEKEPEMTAEEYALYEKIVVMLSNNSQFALKLLEAMVNDKQQPSPAFEFILGNAYYSAGDSAKAEQSYRSAVTRFPTFVRAWNNLGVVYYTSDRFNEAIPCFSKSIVLGDRDPVTFGLLGYSLEQAGNVVSAEMAYMQALGGDPANSDWKEGLLRIYIQGRQFGRAESLVKTLIKERPQDTRFWLTYANILVSEGRKVEATAVLEAAAGLGVGGTDEYTLLGDLYAEQNLAAEAARAYGKISAGAPELGERKLLHLCEVLIATGDLAAADKIALSLQPAALSEPGRIAWRQARADIFFGRQQWPQARAEIEALLSAAPMNGKALLSLGRIYLGEDNVARATFAFESATRVPSAAYRANLELANLELKRRHFDKTVEHLQKALAIERTDAVEDYLARVKSLVTAAN